MPKRENRFSGFSGAVNKTAEAVTTFALGTQLKQGFNDNPATDANTYMTVAVARGFGPRTSQQDAHATNRAPL